MSSFLRRLMLPEGAYENSSEQPDQEQAEARTSHFLVEAEPTRATAEQVANVLFADVVSDMLDDEVWQRLGFRKRPKHGQFVNQWFRNSEQVFFERRLGLEIIVLSFSAHIRVVYAKLDRKVADTIVARALEIMATVLVRDDRFPSKTAAVHFFEDGLSVYLRTNPLEDGEGHCQVHGHGIRVVV